MPATRMNSLKSLAMNCGPLSEMIRGRASGCILSRYGQRHVQKLSYFNPSFFSCVDQRHLDLREKEAQFWYESQIIKSEIGNMFSC